MLFFNLLLGHLLGDFLLQTNGLIKFKHKSAWGVAAHVAILMSVTAALVYPYLHSFSVWVILVFIAATHYAQDRIKILYSPHNKKVVLPFIIDQVIHVSIIAISAFFLQYMNLSADAPAFIADQYGLAVLCSFILIGPVWDMVLFQFVLEKNQHAKYQPAILGMMVRMGVLALILWAFSLF